MASKAKQQNYRRLMKEAKGKSSVQQKKIDHPLARYNALDQLSCIVCQQIVKSELLWGTHLKSKRHKECIAELKNNKSVLQQTSSSRSKGTAAREKSPDSHLPSPPPPPPPPSKRKTEDSTSDNSDGMIGDKEPSAKKQKVSKDTDVREKKSDAKAQNSLPADFFDPGVSKFGEDSDSGDDVRGEEGRGEGGGSSVASQPTAGGPKTEEKFPANSNKKVGSGAEALPEGFFDDPKLDAKARKVEYRDKMEDEWERFQKTIQKEKDVSEAIQHEEDEEAQVGRDLTEVQEQVECFQRAEALRLKQEELLERCCKEGKQEPAALKDDRISQSVGGGALDDSEDDSGGSDLDDLEMDWRAKHS